MLPDLYIIGNLTKTRMKAGDISGILGSLSGLRAADSVPPLHFDNFLCPLTSSYYFLESILLVVRPRS